MLNPIDLGRILILLQLDISVLMGYTGAMFAQLFGTAGGVAVAVLAMVVFCAVPIWLGNRAFRRKDF